MKGCKSATKHVCNVKCKRISIMKEEKCYNAIYSSFTFDDKIVHHCDVCREPIKYLD